ncbi:peptidyl-prolyl cis-trans isomerase FKBP16-3, chloroplastic-like isoform X1 [Zingiber officinale]|uniref:peptidyl-prolyl cis-trans isomerase FKBP16-3, chloroplastic-like isoform X1 n=1 Tax=Zingiber officinale TaxID=94328 RepID=UPI001C4C033B|nr:peptidyl-prolyl cis-trans isomerase FKBP16-3, chloroplastic-like isoform X1 [Zingiber officinale]
MAHALSSALPVLRSSCSTSMAASSSALLLPSGPCLFKRLWCNLHIKPPKVHCLDLDLGQRIRMEMNEDITLSRRSAIGSMFALTTFGLISANSYGAGLPGEEKPRLCDDECEKELENVPMVTTESGLQYKDIKIGEGPSPPIGFQLAFPKGLNSAPGRPRVAPSSPVIFDVILEYVPGLDNE